MTENWLLLETSGRVGKLGLARGDSIARAAELDANRRHARDLAATVGAMLEAEALRPADVTGVMVSIGPGSYTGLRVGIMSAKAFAFATGCRLVAVPTFAAIALQAPVEANHVWVIADALQEHVYLQRFTRSATTDGWVPTDDLRIEPVVEWLQRLEPDAWLTGPGVKVLADSHIPRTCRLVPEAECEPTIASLVRAGLGITPLSRAEMFALEPLYLRGSSAEEKAKHNEPRG